MRPAAAFEAPGKPPRLAGSGAIRFWSVRHAGGLERFYHWFERRLLGLTPLFRHVGFARIEGPVAAVERTVKGALFDCRMCGACILSSTGMACPMNCPKGLRNGPCGGVRANGRCEVYADMPCVWVEAWNGSRLMEAGDRIADVQPPVDHRLKGRSTWLALVRNAAESGRAT